MFNQERKNSVGSGSSEYCGSLGNNPVCVTMPAPNLEEKFKGLHSSLDGLNEVFFRLKDKIQPVLKPAKPEVCDNAAKNSELIQSRLNSELFSVFARIDKLRMEVQELTTLVDL